jgi:polar amino acid transport system substrate-binding protein
LTSRRTSRRITAVGVGVGGPVVSLRRSRGETRKANASAKIAALLAASPERGRAHLRRKSCRLVVICAILAVAAFPGCGSEDSGEPEGASGPASTGGAANDKLAQILTRGTLVEYFEDDYPPQSIRVKGATRPADTKCADNQLTAGEVTGYDNEVPKLIAQELGVEACFVEPTWIEVTAGNWADRWDIAYGSGSINEDRMERLYMTQPYYAVPNFYFVAKSSNYRHASDLDGKAIGACAGCSHELYLKGELEIPSVDVTLNVKNPKIVAFETEAPGLAATSKGKIDAFLAAEPVGDARIAEGAPLRQLSEVAFTYYPSGFVDKSSRLDARRFVDRVNEIVRGLHSDGTLKRLSIKWFGEDYASAAAGFDIDAIGQTVH